MAFVLSSLDQSCFNVSYIVIQVRFANIVNEVLRFYEKIKCAVLHLIHLHFYINSQTFPIFIPLQNVEHIG